MSVQNLNLSSKRIQAHVSQEDFPKFKRAAGSISQVVSFLQIKWLSQACKGSRISKTRCHRANTSRAFYPGLKNVTSSIWMNSSKIN